MAALYTFIAALPVLLTLICLSGFRISSAKTAGLAYAASIIIAAVPWKFRMSLKGLVFASMKGLLLALIVIYVLLFGLFLYNVLRAGRAVDIISELFMRHAKTSVHQALLISGALGPFLEATTGFGLGIVIAAPVYLAMGFQPQKAAILSLLTQSAVPWGALAVGTTLNAELSRVALRALGVGSAIVSIPLFLVYIVTVVCVAGGWRAVWQNTVPILLVWVSLSVSTWAANAYLSTPLAGVLAGLVTSVLLLIYFRVTSQFAMRPSADQVFSKVVERCTVSSIWKAVFPYTVLIVFILATNLWPRFSHWLHTVFVLRVTSLQFQLELLSSPGFALFVASMAGIVIYRLSWRQIRDCALRTIQQVYPAAVSTIGFVAMSTVMQQAGMIDFLARHMAMWVGSGFILISPIIGGLGGFITGSNSAANAMLAPFQNAMAYQLHSSPLLYATVQNVAASNLTMESPSRVALAASIANDSGKEGEITRRIFPLGGLVIFIITVCTLIMKGVLS